MSPCPLEVHQWHSERLLACNSSKSSYDPSPWFLCTACDDLTSPERIGHRQTTYVGNIVEQNSSKIATPRPFLQMTLRDAGKLQGKQQSTLSWPSGKLLCGKMDKDRLLCTAMYAHNQDEHCEGKAMSIQNRSLQGASTQDK